jgi:2-keto-4-pentenoate hydratase/2-oxohepta-3-ene-1,7-dioic acid hydratase in catechol pathway
MKLCRFGDNRLGLVDGDALRDVTAALATLPSHRYPLPSFDPLVAALPELAPRIAAAAREAAAIPLRDVALLSPVANPGKIVAAPVNYRRHLEEARSDPGIHHQSQVLEIQRVGLFLKATSSLVGPAQGVTIRHPTRRNDHEVELAAVIGRRADRVAAAHALDYVAGYCIGLDMTTRGPEERSLRKSIDSYTVLGPWLVTADEIPDPANLDLAITVNGAPRQQANTRDLVLSLPALIELASSFYTLHPGDVLLTGTPEGVRPVQPGDLMTATIARIGRMDVRVHG